MAFKMKGFPKTEGVGGPVTPAEKARLAELRKNINNSGISEDKYNEMKAELRALEAKAESQYSKTKYRSAGSAEF